MRVSVVVSTYNRAHGLRQTLDSFRYQTHPEFEVIAVNGPSTDDTLGVLSEYRDRIKIGHCPKRQLCASRNVGLNLADGEIVAFIDDDAIPEPTWLEQLVAAYDRSDVGAAGGIVYDHTGAKLQYRYAACSRIGAVRLDIEPPLDEYVRPLADPLAYLQGTNMSFRRSVLAEIGGFDENILHYYDDVEIALQVIDRGYRLKPLADAAVHHKYLASHVRNRDRVTLDPFNTVADRVYFALRHGRGTRSTREVLDWLLHASEHTKREAEHFHRVGKMTAEQRDYFFRRVEEALEAGVPKGLTARRASVRVAGPDPERFLPHPTVRPRGRRLKLCFLSKEYPPGDFGGVGRYTAELASGFAAAGHEVHVVTASPDAHRVDCEQGVWVHRLPTPDRWVPELWDVPLIHNLALVTAGYREVCRIHERGPVDLVSAPLWLSEGAVCQLDPRFPTVLTLMTCLKAIIEMHPSFREVTANRQQIALEDETVAGSRHIHAISNAILDRAVKDYSADRGKAFVAPLGLADRRPLFPRRRGADGRIRVLFVGRLEVRKGADLFIDAAVRLCREFPQAEFVLAGKDTPNTELGETYRARFDREHAADPDLHDRIRFTGMLTEEELFQAYADTDIFCLPSRYESFGLVFVEAMMFGVPVVGCRIGGMTEVIDDGTDGYLTEPGDVASLTAALRKLIVDPAHRARLGANARESYERKFALPRVVERMEGDFRNVIARHQSAAGPANAQPPAEAIATRFAEAIARATGIAPDAARRAAERLLDPTCHPTDFLAPLARLAGEPDGEFISHSFRTIIGRDPTPADYQHWLGELMSLNGDRAEVIRRYMQSWEASHNGVPATLAERLQMIFPPTPVPMPAPVSVVVRRPSLRERLATAPRVGKALKYLRRLIMLPWNFHKFYTAHLPATEARIDSLRERIGAIEATLDRQLTPMLAELAARQDHLRHLMWVMRNDAGAAARELPEILDDRLVPLTEALTNIADLVSDAEPAPVQQVIAPRVKRAA